MHFCSVCSNMYYISIDPNDNNKLIYYCRNCGNTDSLLSVENTTVSRVQLKKSQQEFSHIINKHTKLDPTLPRVNKISHCIKLNSIIKECSNNNTLLI